MRTVFVLPAGYRPGFQIYSAGDAIVVIDASGNVSLTGTNGTPNNTWQSFDSISFFAEN